MVSLGDFAGKGHVLVYFYPKDDTPGCTKEACSLRDGFAGLRAAGVTVLGISPDGADSHNAFASKYSLPFELLTDADHAVHELRRRVGERLRAALNLNTKVTLLAPGGGPRSEGGKLKRVVDKRKL